MAFCTNCGNKITDEKFCTTCGARNENMETNDIVANVKSETGICENCGSKIADEKFCTACGAKNEKVDQAKLFDEKLETFIVDYETVDEKSSSKFQKEKTNNISQTSDEVQRDKSSSIDQQAINSVAENLDNDPLNQDLYKSKKSKKSKKTLLAIIVVLVLGGCVIYFSLQENVSYDLSKEVGNTSPEKSNTNGVRGQIIIESKKHLGKPYSFGSMDPSNGFDNSGYVSYVYKKSIKIDLPKGARLQFSSGGGILVNYDQLKPGDLMFFSFNGRLIQHVGIYLGEDKFIHSPREGRVVSIDAIDSNWKKWFVKGKSYLDGKNKITTVKSLKNSSPLTVDKNVSEDNLRSPEFFYINAERGLNLRSFFSTKSKVILKLEYNDRVELIEKTNEKLTVRDYDSEGNFLGNITDFWVKVRFVKENETFNGYVFNGYLSESKLPNLNSTKIANNGDKPGGKEKRVSSQPESKSLSDAINSSIDSEPAKNSKTSNIKLKQRKKIKTPSDKSELDFTKGFRVFTSQIARSDNWNYRKYYTEEEKRFTIDYYDVIDLNTDKIEYKVQVKKNKKGQYKQVIYIDMDTGKVVMKSKN